MLPAKWICYHIMQLYLLLRRVVSKGKIDSIKKKKYFSIKLSETKRISTCSVFGINHLVSPKDVSPDLILKLVLEPATAVRVLNYRL